MSMIERAARAMMSWLSSREVGRGIFNTELHAPARIALSAALTLSEEEVEQCARTMRELRDFGIALELRHNAVRAVLSALREMVEGE